MTRELSLSATLHEVSSLPTADRLSAARWDALWLDGAPSALASPLVALIGTREPSPFTAALTRRIACELAQAGVHVLSGGALGVDAQAHRGAIQARGRTVVVLPCGLAHWYPQRHKSLYEAVLDHGGALVSQFPPETPPCRWTFPRRNELVATLADVVVVMQAPRESGALLAAESARRLGRRLMAVPHAPDLDRGEGSLQLLRDGAAPCTCAEDILKLLDAKDGPLWSPASPERTPARPAPSRVRARTRVRNPSPVQGELQGMSVEAAADLSALDEDGRLVYESLAATPRHVDEVARFTGLSTSRIQRSLLTLVLAGLIEDRGGGTYALPR